MRELTRDDWQLLEALLDTRYDALRGLLRETEPHETEAGRRERAGELLAAVRAQVRWADVRPGLRRHVGDVLGRARRMMLAGCGYAVVARGVELELSDALAERVLEEVYGDELEAVRAASRPVVYDVVITGGGLTATKRHADQVDDPARGEAA